MKTEFMELALPLFWLLWSSWTFPLLSTSASWNWFPLNQSHHVTFIIVYAPTPDRLRQQFYSDLYDAIKSTGANYKLTLLDDFSARFGKDNSSWRDVMGKHGVGKLNSIGLLLSICAEYKFQITNKMCWAQTPDHNKMCWAHTHDHKQNVQSTNFWSQTLQAGRQIENKLDAPKV